MYGSQNKQRLFLYTALTDWFSIEKNIFFFSLHNAYSQSDAKTTCFGLTNTSSSAFISLHGINWLVFDREKYFFFSLHNAYSQLDAQTTCFGLTNPSSGAFIQDKQQWNALTRQDQYIRCVFIVGSHMTNEYYNKL